MRPCHICGSTDWWWRQSIGSGEWLCGRCHPNPKKEAEMRTDKEQTDPDDVAMMKDPVLLERLQNPGETISLEEMREELEIRQPYRLADGTIVPGVTTVLGILEKPGLHYWIADTTKAGEDWIEVRDAAGRVGTITHYLIACHLKGEKTDSSQFYPDEVDHAETCFEKYLAWEKENHLVPVIIETPFVSEEFKYGGTPDLLAEIDGDFVLIDFKTSGRIYDNYFCQLAAYKKLLEEQGWPVSSARILRIGADEDEDFEERIRTNLDTEFQIFTRCLEIYRLRKS